MPTHRPILTAAIVLGIGLGGSFDGILLHQVLQWHHLLSLVPGEAFRDLGTQILADGLFHVLMYGITASGLWMLWRRRGGLNEAGAGRAVAGGAVLGFALWNVIDVVFFHWTLGIHRIRLSVPDPMAYDLGWLFLFGVAPLGLAWWALRRGSGGGGNRAGATLALLALIAAPLAALPPRGSRSAIVLFAPGTPPGAQVNAILSSGGRLIWADPRGRMMAVELQTDQDGRALYRAGAMLVTRSPLLAGCAAAAS
ncbi:MAG TPA: DUF2243 domain-containing protein [Allosphingosinicella sp.]|jgi:uncharacterized membrane protein|uniref:DUF2243 domain-containing protein n=1 Tax=Allosphingosinicella sp. TaxID=2823234 RepID=UPI002F284D16